MRQDLTPSADTGGAAETDAGRPFRATAKAVGTDGIDFVGPHIAGGAAGTPEHFAWLTGTPEGNAYLRDVYAVSSTGDAHTIHGLLDEIASLRARLTESETDAQRWRFVRSKLSDGGTCYMPGRRHCSVRLQINIGAWFPSDGSEVSPEAIVDAARLTPPEPT